MKFSPLIAVFGSVFLLSSCMSLDSRMDIRTDGNSHSVVDLDMSRMVTLLSAFGTGAEIESSINKNLCDDPNFRDGLDEGLAEQDDLKNLKCTSLGDYKARIEGDLSFSGKKGRLSLSGGVTVYDLIELGGGSQSPMGSASLEDDTSSAEMLGLSFTQTYTLAGNIVYTEAGTLSGNNTLSLNVLDPKILKRNTLIVITTDDGRKLTRKEINRYKLELRKYNRTIRD